MEKLEVALNYKAYIWFFITDIITTSYQIVPPDLRITYQILTLVRPVLLQDFHRSLLFHLSMLIMILSLKI
jgi:hypothetical protein